MTAAASFVFVELPAAAYIGDVKALATTLLTLGTARRDLELAEKKPIDLAGLSGWQRVAHVIDTRSGHRIGLYAVTLAGTDGGYARFEGSAPDADFDKLLPEFRKIAASLSLTR